MRHDPAGAAIVIMLRSLKMPGMAQAVHDLMEQGAPAFEAAMPMLSQLLKAEVAEREVRSVAYHMKAARFPCYKDLSGFDFAASEANEVKTTSAALKAASNSREQEDEAEAKMDQQERPGSRTTFVHLPCH